MSNDLKEKKGYKVLSESETKILIKRLSKKTFDYRKVITTEKDWWTMANFCIEFDEDYNRSICGRLRRALLSISETSLPRVLLEEAVIKTFFAEKQQEQSAWQLWDRGMRQSLNYKLNRITDNMRTFFSWSEELRTYRQAGPTESDTVKTLRETFNIDSIFCGYCTSSNSESPLETGLLGVVEASTREDAYLQLSMFVYPLIGQIPDNQSIQTRWCGFISSDQKMDAFIYYNGKLIEERQERIENQKNRISVFNSRIKVNDMIIDTARNNLLANISVHDNGKKQ
jgi:hypothetical protein